MPVQGADPYDIRLWFGSGATTYQWRKNGVDIPGATGFTYNFDSVSAVRCR